MSEPAKVCATCLFWQQFSCNRFLGVCEHPEKDGEATDRTETCDRYQENQ